MRFQDLNWVKIIGNFGVAFFTSAITLIAFNGGIEWCMISAGLVLGLLQGCLALFKEIQEQASGTQVRMPRKQPYVTKSKMPRKQPWVTKALMFYATLF